MRRPSTKLDRTPVFEREGHNYTHPYPNSHSGWRHFSETYYIHGYMREGEGWVGRMDGELFPSHD